MANPLSRNLLRRSLIQISVAAALTMPGTASLAAGPYDFSYLGQQIVPSGTQSLGTTIGGLSGIDYVAASGSSGFTTGSYIAISDDRSALSNVRFYSIGLNLSGFQRTSSAGSAAVSFNSVTTILTPGGSPFAINTVDPESIRLDSRSGTLIWTNEGQRSASGFQNPTLRTMMPNGTHGMDFAVGNRYNPIGSVGGNTGGDSGIRNNLAFESLTLSTSGQSVFIATENALAQDGPASTATNGTYSRVAEFDRSSGALTREFAYYVEPVQVSPNPATGFATNGLVERLAIDDTNFFMLERSFSSGIAGTGNTIKLYLASLDGATDVFALSSLTGGGFSPMQKSLLLDLGTLQNDDGSFLALDNVEGMTWGPTLASGKRSLILVSDNNFSATQFTQFVALEVAPVPEPEVWAMMSVGLLLSGFVARRRRIR